MKVTNAMISKDCELILIVDDKPVIVDDKITQALKQLLTKDYHLSKEERSFRVKAGFERAGYKPSGKKADKEKHERIIGLLNAKVCTREEIAKAVDCGVATVYRVAKEWQEELQRKGIEKAKANGKYKGRKPKISSSQVEELRQAVASGKSKTDLAKQFGITRATLYSCLKDDYGTED